MYSVIQDWKLDTRLEAITTDNGSDMVKGVSNLLHELNEAPENQFVVGEVHRRCMAHIVNLAVKASLSHIHTQVGNIRSLVSGIRQSTKRRE